MARCPDCNKFVSYDTDLEPEVDGEEVSETTFTANVRRALPCGDCGTELKEYTFEVEHDFSDEIDAAHEKCTSPEASGDGKMHDFEIVSCNASTSDGVKDTDRHGRKIKSARYMTTLYGFELEVELKCSLCAYEISFTVNDDAEASSFEEM